MKSPLDPLAQNHPLRKALWIWPESYMYLHNCLAQFRRDFDLPAVPKHAPFFITADKAYRLHVNGTFVCRGPARGYQSHWPFDEVDLSPYLQKGRNWISVEGYNPGISTFQYIHHTQAGLICAARWGKFELYSGPGWAYRRSPGHRTDTARYSMQIDFQEDVDAGQDDRAWITGPKAPEGWDGRYTPHAQYMTDNPFGRPPWDTLEPRGIPLLRERIITPVGVTAQASGQNGEDYKTRRNISWGWVEEAGKVKSWQSGENVPAKKSGDWFEVIIGPAGEGLFNAVTIDMGGVLLANLIVEVDGAAGGEILDFQHDQCLRSGKPAFLKTGDGSSVALANRMHLKAGKNLHEFYHLLAFKHVTVVCRDLKKPITLRIKAREAGYPFTFAGSFSSSDTTLNGIYQVCRRTQQLCALDAYMDTPWREQAQWWGDARVQGRNTFYMDGDPRLLIRGIRSIAEQKTAEGLTYGHAPTVAYNCILPDFSLTWILTLWDVYWQTGDISLFREQWPSVQDILGYFHTDGARAKDGLLRYDRRFWLFEDWSDLTKDAFPAFLNLWYLYTLRHTVRMLKLCRMNADARRVEAEARSLEKVIVARFFDPKAGLFCESLNEKGRQIRRFSVHDQVFALMLNLVPQSRQVMIDKRILPCLKDGKFEGARPSAFWSTYLLEQAALLGFHSEAIDYIRRKWEPMLSTGTTWEGFDWDEHSGGTCTHAWTAHPSYHFVNILAGVRQQAAGWDKISFSPAFIEGIDHAEAVIPSPHGLIKAGWKKSRGAVKASLSLPAGVTAEVKLPGVNRMVKGKGKFTFG